MVRFLVWAIDAPFDPKVEDGKQRWKRGDVVAVVEDDGEFGTAFDDHTSFRIVEVPGVPASKYQYVTSPDTEMIADPLNTKASPKETLIRKTLYSLDMDKIDAAYTAAPGEKLSNVSEATLSLTEKPPPV